MLTRELIDRPEGWMLKLTSQNRSLFLGPVAVSGAPIATARQGAKAVMKFMSKNVARMVVEAKAAGDL